MGPRFGDARQLQASMMKPWLTLNGNVENQEKTCMDNILSMETWYRRKDLKDIG